MLELFDLSDLFLSWRLFLGIAITVGVCYGLVMLIPFRIPDLLVVILVGLPGAVLSFWWQIRADRSK